MIQVRMKEEKEQIKKKKKAELLILIFSYIFNKKSSGRSTMNRFNIVKKELNPKIGQKMIR